MNSPSFSRKIRGLAALLRPELPAAAGVCTLAGQILARGALPRWSTALLGFTCAFALSGAALILNDYFDLEVDRVNHPDRPLPSGAVTKTDVLVLTGAVNLVGLAAAAGLGRDALWIGIVFWAIGVLYNWRYKESGLPGNLMVAASVGVTFVLGGVTAGAPGSPLVWTYALMAFFLDLGEEIAGDAMDMEGDRLRGCRSLALLKGKDFAVRAAVGMWAVVAILVAAPAALGWLTPWSWALVLVLDGLIGFYSVRLLRSTTPREGRAAMRGVYLGATLAILLGVVAFLILGKMG